MDPSDRNQILTLYYNGDIIEFLYRNNVLCDSLELGSGTEGNVYTYRFQRNNLSLEYAVKQFDFAVTTRILNKAISLPELIALTPELDANLIVLYNGGDPNRIFKVGETFYLPQFAQICRTKEALFYPSNSGSSKTTFVPPGSLICPTTIYPEALIGIIMANYFNRGQCLHFIDTIDFISCGMTPEAKTSTQYLFMERIDSDLYKANDYDEEYLLQIISAIAMYQESNQIIHGDLHGGNVFLLKLTSELSWNGNNISEASYFEYRLMGQSFFIKGTPYLVKIGDWGRACKYTAPMIGSDLILDRRWSGNNPTIPNFYAPIYDLLLILTVFFANNQTSEFIRRCMAWCLGLPLDTPRSNLTNFANGFYIDEQTLRPIVSRLEDDIFTKGYLPYGKSALYLLKNGELMAPYRQRPEGKGIILTDY
jgi:hypothetical protein